MTRQHCELDNCHLDAVALEDEGFRCSTHVTEGVEVHT